MKRIILLTMMSLALLSCKKIGSPVTTRGSLDDYKVEKLFEVDGVTVYRFYDGKYIYFTNRTGDVSSVETRTTHNGKSTQVYKRMEQITLCN